MFGLFSDPHAILQFAELGVVMFLFIIGLEMRPSHLWHLRRQIFGLGTLQISACTLGLTGVGMAFGLSPVVAFIGGAGFVLTSTAIVMQLLAERGDIALPHGQKMVSVLLFEDLLIVPLLALVSFLSPTAATETDTPHWISMLIGIGSLAGLIAAGVWLLNPLFSILALARTREVMSARGAAGRARLGVVDGNGRPLDGHGRVPRRRAVVRIDVPSSARSGCRAVPRIAVGIVLPGRRHEPRLEGGRGQLGADRRLSCRR